MIALVVDASVAVKWVVDEEGSEAAAELSDCELAAPEILLGECANALWTKARSKELTPTEAVERFQVLRAAPVEWVAIGDLAEHALQLALRLAHPVYDCLYLALAVQRGVALVTADRRFVEAIKRQPDFGGLVRLLGKS